MRQPEQEIIMHSKMTDQVNSFASTIEALELWKRAELARCGGREVSKEFSGEAQRVAWVVAHCDLVSV